MAELNLLIRKLIQNGHRDSAFQLIANIIQRIEAKNKVNKVGCVFPIVVVSIPLHAEFRPNDHGKGAPHFMTRNDPCRL